MIKKLFLAVVFAASLLFTSCNSVPKDIPDSLSAQELIQNGQSCFESGNYKASLVYYETAVKRFPDDAAIYIEARYEIGHVYMKQKKLEKAEVVFSEISEIYKNSAPGALPAAYKKLSEIGLEKIQAKRNKK